MLPTTGNVAEHWLQGRTVGSSVGRLLGGFITAVIAGGLVALIAALFGANDGIGRIIAFIFFLGAMNLGASVALRDGDMLDRLRWTHFKSGMWLGLIIAVALGIWAASQNVGSLSSDSSVFIAFCALAVIAVVCGLLLVALYDRSDKASICRRVADFLARPIEGSRWPYLLLGALPVPTAQGDRSTRLVLAVGLNDVPWEVLGVTVGDASSEEFWESLFNELKQRGLKGVKVVIADANAGEKAAANVFGARWQTLEHYLKTEQPAGSIMPAQIQNVILAVSNPIRSMFQTGRVFPNDATVAWLAAERLSAQDAAKKAGVDVMTARY